eukprot:7391546-Prymnesium_polylepis.2
MTIGRIEPNLRKGPQLSLAAVRAAAREQPRSSVDEGDANYLQPHHVVERRHRRGLAVEARIGSADLVGIRADAIVILDRQADRSVHRRQELEGLEAQDVLAQLVLVGLVEEEQLQPEHGHAAVRGELDGHDHPVEWVCHLRARRERENRMMARGRSFGRGARGGRGVRQRSAARAARAAAASARMRGWHG